MPHIHSALDLNGQMQRALDRHGVALERITAQVNAGRDGIADLAEETMRFAGEIARVVESLTVTVSLLADVLEWTALGSGNGVDTP